MKFTKEAQDYFDRHPSSNECHITSDGRVWHNKGGAQGFAGTLEDNAIESYNRKVLESDSKKADDFKNELTEEQKAELLTIDVEKASYNDLKNFAKVFEIKTEDQKAETLKAAITEFKNNQKPTE